MTLRSVCGKGEGKGRGLGRGKRGRRALVTHAVERNISKGGRASGWTEDFWLNVKREQDSGRNASIAATFLASVSHTRHAESDIPWENICLRNRMFPVSVQHFEAS